jgi:hypothetical protein
MASVSWLGSLWKAWRGVWEFCVFIHLHSKMVVGVHRS